MAFVPEDGSGLPNSNGYITVAFFVAYQNDRGRSLIDPTTTAQYTDPQIEQAIVVSSDYLDAKYTFIGSRLKETQAMAWPRVNAFYSDGRTASGVPIEVQECIAELVLKQLPADVEIAPDPTYDPSNRPIIEQMNKVGPIVQDTKFVDGGSPILFHSYPLAEQKLKELIITGSFVERV